MRKLGVNKSDTAAQIWWGGVGKGLNGRRDEELHLAGMTKVRLVLMKVVFVAAMVMVGLRLFELQVVQGQTLRARSDNNRIYRRTFSAPRGVITDRKGVPLVVNQPIYRLMTTDEGKLRMDTALISREEALRREAGGDSSVVYDVGRYYPWGPVMAHVVGYVAEAGEEEVASGYTLGDLVGRAGVEREYENALAGVRGSELVEVDAVGKVIRRVGQEEPTAGVDVGLTVDAGLQQELYRLMDGNKGVVVATNPNNGEILALVSSPSFDPNLFSLESNQVGSGKHVDEVARQKELAVVLTSEDQPLLDRAVAGIYPPGSVFKVVPAVAGLETGKVNFETKVNDEGALTVDQYRYGNWYFDQYGRTEGEVDLVTALKRSNDIFFYKVGEWLGPVTLGEWAGNFGLGKLTGVDLPGEVAGLVPTPAWKEKVKGERWFLGNTYHMAIGQGDVLVTPLGLNQMMGVIASGGRWCRPHVLKSKGGVDQHVTECHEVGISQENLDLVKSGLVAACQTGGTGYPLFGYDLGQYGPEYAGDRSKVACKTGTAQFVNSDNLTHAWFSVFAPAVNPEIQLTVLVEGGGEGSAVAAPIARQALGWWFENK